jgi:reverse gyrase
MWRKACPKCAGTVYRERLPAAEYDLVCLQCGRILSKQEERTLFEALRARQPAAAEAPKQRPAGGSTLVA